MTGTSPEHGRAVRVADDAETLAHAAASVLLASAMAHDQPRDFTVALTGGRTPVRMHELLAAPPLSRAIPWGRIRFLWGDERCVPPDHPESNYGMARRTLLDRVPHDPAKVHRMKGEDGPEGGAAAYGAVVSDPAILPRDVDAEPSFDLLYLGLGEDGHTASLFPGSPALSDTSRHVVPAHAPVTNMGRITITPRLINAAKLVVVVVSGASKAQALRRVLEEQGPVDEVPARVIAPRHGAVLWLVDRAAARDLSPGLARGTNGTGERSS